MKRACMFLIALATAAGVQARANDLRTALPVVGFLQSVDPSVPSIVLAGPDGKTVALTIPVGRKAVHMSRGPIEWAELAELAGAHQAVAAFRTAPHAANLVFLTDDLTEPIPYYLRRILEKDQLVELDAGGGTERLRPAVNLGASDEPGADLDTAGWEWLTERIGEPFKIRLVKAMGYQYIWSIEPWDPEAEPR